MTSVASSNELRVLLVAFALRQRGHFGLEHGVEVFGRRRERTKRKRSKKKKTLFDVVVFWFRVLLRELLAF